MVGILPHPVIDFFSSCVAHTSGVFRFHKLSNLCVNALSIIQKWMVRVSFRCAVVVRTSNICELGVIVRVIRSCIVHRNKYMVRWLRICGNHIEGMVKKLPL